jgi:hypothetical protein
VSGCTLTGCATNRARCAGDKTRQVMWLLTGRRHVTAEHFNLTRIAIPVSQIYRNGLFRLVRIKPSSGHILQKPFVTIMSRTTSEDSSM